MRKFNIMIISLKKNILPILFCIFTICLVLFSKPNLEAASDGLILWANAVVPSLFPFFVATELLKNTNIVYYLGKALNRVMRPIFNVPGEGSFPFLMGILSGYPVGAKIVTGFRKDHICTQEEAERLLTFTNNSGPLFIIGTVGISLFGNTAIGLLLFATHLLACITVGILFRFWKKDAKTSSPDSHLSPAKKPLHFSDLGEVLQASIMNSISTVVLIGGFVVLFSVIISILTNSHILQLAAQAISPIFETLHIDTDFARPLLTGMIELTNGVKLVSNIAVKNISLNIIFCAFLLGFGGISVLLQVFSITSKSDISIKPYFIGKLLQGCLAGFYTFLALKLIPGLNLDLEPVFANATSKVPILASYYSGGNWFILVLLCMLILLLLRFKKKQISPTTKKEW